VLVLPTLPVHVIKAAVLHGGDVQFEQTARTLTFSVPSGSQDSIDTILKLKLAEPWTVPLCVFLSKGSKLDLVSVGNNARTENTDETYRGKIVKASFPL